MFTRNFFNEFDRMSSEMDHIRRLMSTRPTAGVYPLINVTEDRDHIFVRAELPGIGVNDLDITATADSLSISGTRKIATQSDNARYHRREREAGKFSRVFNLPTAIDNNKVDAKLNNGILTIKLAKAESVKPRQIAIS